MVRPRLVVAFRPEHALEPLLAQAQERHLPGLAGAPERVGQRAERDALLLLVPRDRVGLLRELGGELLGLPDQLQRLVVEDVARLCLEHPQLLALAVVVRDREPRLRRAERQLLAAEAHPRRELLVLERVLSFDELGGDDPALAHLPEPVELLTLVAGRSLLR